MCDIAVCMELYSLEFVPDRFKTQKICNEAVRRKPETLGFVPDILRPEGCVKGQLKNMEAP